MQAAHFHGHHDSFFGPLSPLLICLTAPVGGASIIVLAYVRSQGCIHGSRPLFFHVPSPQLAPLLGTVVLPGSITQPLALKYMIS